MKTALKTIILLILFSLLAPLSYAQNQSQWPTFHGNEAKTGFSHSTAPSKPNILWQLTTLKLKELGIDGLSTNRPIIDNEKLFFTTTEVIALDLQTGNLIWRYKDETTNFYPNGLTAGNKNIFVTVNNTSLIKTMNTGSIFALDKKTGQFLWKYQTQSSISHSLPLFAAGKVFIGDDLGYLHAIDAENGKSVWQKYLEGAEVLHSSPSFDQGIIFIGTEGVSDPRRDPNKKFPSRLYALKEEDGEEIWKFEIDRLPNRINLIHSTPAVSNGVVYFGSENGYFYALEEKTGALIWKQEIATGDGLVGTSSAAALGYEKVFIGTWKGGFLALDQKNGQILWKYNLGEKGTNSSAVVADKKVYLGSNDGYFYCLNETNGKAIWKEKLGGSSAALASGILIVPNRLAGDISTDQTPVIIAFSEKGKTLFPLSFILIISGSLILVLLFFRKIIWRNLERGKKWFRNRPKRFQKQ